MPREDGESGVPSLSELVDKPAFDHATPSAPNEPKPEPVKEPVAKESKDDPDKRFAGVLRETLEEREKRQKAERERDQYKSAWEQHQRKLQAEEANDPAPDMFKDPDGYNAWVERQLDKRAQAIASKHVEPLQQKVSDYALRLSAMQTKASIGDERWAKLNDWISKLDPKDQQWLQTQPDPYGAAYAEYRRVTTFERLGSDDLDTYEQKLREKIKAELMAQSAPVADDFDDEEPSFAPKPAPTPRSFAGQRSAGGTRVNEYSGPKPLSQIVAEKQPRGRR